MYYYVREENNGSLKIRTCRHRYDVYDGHLASTTKSKAVQAYRIHIRSITNGLMDRLQRFRNLLNQAKDLKV